MIPQIWIARDALNPAMLIADDRELGRRLDANLPDSIDLPIPDGSVSRNPGSSGQGWMMARCNLPRTSCGSVFFIYYHGKRQGVAEQSRMSVDLAINSMRSENLASLVLELRHLVGFGCQASCLRLWCTIEAPYDTICSRSQNKLTLISRNLSTSIRVSRARLCCSSF